MQKKINKRRQRNNHARAKRRVQALKLKMSSRRIMDKRQKKLSALKKPKGQTIYGVAKKQAIHISMLFPNADSWIRGIHQFNNLNQRQKRKLWRQAPHMRLKCA